METYRLGPHVGVVLTTFCVASMDIGKNDFQNFVVLCSGI